MKSKILLALVAVVALVAFGAVIAYNNFVRFDEEVATKFHDLETCYQERLDLIPNLVEIVKGSASHEKEVLKEVMEARSKVASIQIDPSNITPEQLAEYQKAQAGVSSAIGRLIAVAENYPNLKANEAFVLLQHQCEGMENRIRVARIAYNDAVKSYNIAIRIFPNNILASIMGMERKLQFEADEGAEKAPKVKF
jgi:LemA protein